MGGGGGWFALKGTFLKCHVCTIICLLFRKLILKSRDGYVGCLPQPKHILGAKSLVQIQQN